MSESASTPQSLIESTRATCIGDTPLQQRCRELADTLESTLEQLEAAREQLAAPRDVTALRVGIDWHSHDGMVTVYDRDGRYLGCMGVERFHRLLAEDAISRGSNPATTSLAK